MLWNKQLPIWITLLPDWITTVPNDKNLELLEIKYIAQPFQLYQEPAKWWLVRSPTKSINLVSQIRERMTKFKMEEPNIETYLRFKLFFIFNCCIVMFELCLWFIILELFYFYAFRRFCNVRTKVVDIVLVPAVPTCMYHTGTYIGIEIPMFRTSLNTSCTDHISAIQANFGQ